MKKKLTYWKILFLLALCWMRPVDGNSQNRGMVSFGVHLSDYRLLAFARDSSLSYALHQKTLLQSGKANFGLQVGYWLPVNNHFTFSGDLGATLSNFPSGFVKGDSIGQAGISLFADGLMHYQFLGSPHLVNPFLTAGLGGGLFGLKGALYLPVGWGIDFHFVQGGTLLMQMQMRKALTSGLTSDFLFYSIGFAQGLPWSKNSKAEENQGQSRTQIPSIPSRQKEITPEKQSSPKPKLSPSRQIALAPAEAQDTALQKARTNSISENPQRIAISDADSDGVVDVYDRCPNLKGTASYEGCPFPLIPDALLLKMTPDSVTYLIYFDFDKSDLYTQAFSVLYQVMELLRADSSLSVSIAGYADSKGSIAKNLRVSEDRAKITRDYLLSYDIAPSRIKWAYYGSSNPVDPVIQWKNRRVEITLLRNKHAP